MIYILIAVFSVILFRIFYLNVFMGSYYQMILKNKIDNVVKGDDVPRGRIYDRNYNIIVDNTAVKSIYYTKNKNTTKEDEIALSYELSNFLSLDYENLLERNLKEFFLILYEDYGTSLITDEEYKDLELRRKTQQEIYELKIDRIKEEDLNKLNELDRKAAYLYYLMNKGYSYEEKIIKEEATDVEYAYISENSAYLNGFDTKLTWKRIYPYEDVFRTILGTISSITKEDKDYYLNKGYSLDDVVGSSGIEKQYEEILKGEKALYEINDDNSLSLLQEGTIGNDIVLSIDIELQKQIEEMLEEEIIKTKSEANTEFFNKAFVVIEDPKTGEILAMAGKQYLNNDMIDYNYGAMTYAVTPGSIVKAASMTVGYNEKVIDIGTVMEDRCIKLANIPLKCSWKTLGTINDLDALKWSSNVYQYKIAMMVGGFTYAYGKELSINEEAFDTYRKTFYQYGLGVKTGIDYPIEEVGVKGTNTAGDLLINFAIGQYDTYTPLQLTQYMSTIANNGSRMKTRFLKYILKTGTKEILYEEKPITLNNVEIETTYLDRIKEGLRLVTSQGTGVGYMTNASSSAGKTGTSESFVDINFDGIVDFESTTNTFAGYAPFNNPVMVVSSVSPDVQNPNKGEYKSDVNRRIANKATTIFFNLYDEFGNKK